MLNTFSFTVEAAPAALSATPPFASEVPSVEVVGSVGFVSLVASAIVNLMNMRLL